ncbi:MAG: GNAT family N-acetyltransferase [Tepidanaerobacteraceae bacterium]|jgi:predicted acetyltransferase|nr:GNAT family N-acetyltransferase [Tepidanaerobacteraceae bacterium]
MDELELVRPMPSHKNSAEEFKREFFSCGEKIINGSALLDQMEYDKWLENVERNSSPETARKDWVVADTFFAVRKADDRIIGMVDIRHNLDNEFLSKYGGHIGYAVRPSERRKGYATQILKMALQHAKSIGLSRVMLGCYSDNLASIKTIEKCGGVLAETKPYVDGKPMNVYWIANI